MMKTVETVFFREPVEGANRQHVSQQTHPF